MKVSFKRSKPLFTAAELGDTEQIIALLDQGEAIDPCDKYGQTPLIVAIAKGQTKAASLLIKRGANVNHRTKGPMPLPTAAAKGNVVVAKQLIKAGADVNAVGAMDSPAMLAAESGEMEVLELLIQAGCDLNARSFDEQTALMKASPLHLGVVELLLKHGADPKLCNDLGQTASEHAIAEAKQWRKNKDSAMVEAWTKKAEFLKKFESKPKPARKKTKRVDNGQ